MVIWVLMNIKLGKKPYDFVPSSRINPSASCEWSQRSAELEIEKTSLVQKTRVYFSADHKRKGWFSWGQVAHLDCSCSSVLVLIARWSALSYLLCWFNNYPKWQAITACRKLSAGLLCPTLSGVCCRPTRPCWSLDFNWKEVKELD